MRALGSDCLRIISGSKRGFKLKRPKTSSIRPTQDRVKESLFNILGYIDDSIVLDLFAGSGAIGIEFLSRGAKRCYFVDVLGESIKVIKKNLYNTELMDKAFIFKQDAFDVIKKFSKKGLEFDYIYIDPPYSKSLEYKILKILCDVDIIKEDGIIIVEHSRKNSLEDNIMFLQKIDSRNYGDKSLTFYKKVFSKGGI